MGSLVSGIAGLVGAGDESSGVSSGAALQAQGTSQAEGVLGSTYGQIQANNQPWMTAGTGALSSMQQMTAAGPPQFTQADFLANQDPAYGFDLQQGTQAVQRSAAAAGGLQSGGTLTALNNYAQGMASNEYSNAYNRFMNAQNTQFSRLGTIAGMGYGATQSMNQAAMGYGNAMSNVITGGANAQAGAQVANGQIWGNAINNIGQGIGGQMMGNSMMSGGNPLTTTGGAYMPAGAADPSAGGMYGANALSAPALGSSAGGGGAYSLLAGM